MLPQFDELSEIARCLLVVPASEAAVEMEFWKQLQILTNERKLYVQR
jgi:hypothetical protein